MKITLITVGKIKEKYLKDAIAEYSKRLGRYCKKRRLITQARLLKMQSGIKKANAF